MQFKQMRATAMALSALSIYAVQARGEAQPDEEVVTTRKEA